MKLCALCLKNFGIPVSIYSDGHTIFKSPLKDKLSIEEQLAGKRISPTQFGRAMKELGVTSITARSPQAKGRVECLWETLQSRLPVEFKRSNINTVNEVNAFLSKYIYKFNKQFAVEPENTDDNGGGFPFYSKHFKIIQSKELPPLPKSVRVDVLISPISVLRCSTGTPYTIRCRILSQRKLKNIALQKRGRLGHHRTATTTSTVIGL